MQLSAEKTTGYTLANPIVGSADLKNIMQVEFHPLKMTDRGRCLNFRTLQPEKRRDGLNGNLNNLVGVACGGLQNTATPSEGAKRRYPAHFVSKLTDADGELQETIHWLGRAGKYGYLERTKHIELEDLCQNIGRKLGKMIQIPESFA